MSEIHKISPAHIDEARKAAEAAAEHFSIMLTNSERVVSGVRLVGGYGETGVYQGRLGSFAEQWSAVVAEFLEDERAFVAFLGQLHERLRQANQLYLDNEETAAGSLTEIGRQLDGQGR